ncbi:MAG: GNAT family N-acetyltransferase [Bacillota bacterium]
MDEPITVREVESNEDIAEFWRYRDEYITRDIFPNDTLGKPLTKEDLDWFLSKEYKDLMMKLFHRDEDKVRFVFFERDGKKIGFCSYVTYFSEDKKCFLVDFCVLPEFRRRGFGKACFRLLKEKETKKGADYFELNISTEDNRCFWESLGFEFNGFDEYGNILYQLKPEQLGEITYELFRMKDFDQLKQLMVSYKKSAEGELMTDTDKSSLKDAIENKEIFFFVAKRKTRLIGMCLVRPRSTTCRCEKGDPLDNLYILPVYQNTDVATNLAKFASDWCENHKEIIYG